MTNIPGVTFIDNPHAPEVFSDNASGVFFLNGNIRITFESVKIDHSTAPGPANRVVVARLIMPIDRAENMIVMLQDFIAKQKGSAETLPQMEGPKTIQ